MAAGAPARAEKKKPGLFDFESWKMPVTREREAAKDITPGSIDLTPAVTAKGDARVLKLRIYADPDYRSVVMRWQSKARAQVSRINAVLQPVFNARFEIESFKEWDRGHVGMPLHTVLDEMRKLDPATDVDLVVGFVTPLRGVATSIHAIGQSSLLARHFIMRGMDDEQEGIAIDQEFTLLSPDERRRLYVERKAHKEVVVFLHEWGHTLGLLHREQANSIMNPKYDPKQSVFSDYQKRVISVVVDRRIARRSEPYPEAADLVPLFEVAPPDEGSDKERAELLAFVRQWARGGGGPPRAAAGAGAGPGGNAVDLPPADVEAFNRSVELLNGGRAVDAWTALAPVIERAGKRKTAPQTWKRLAEMASAIGAFSAAEDAVVRGGENVPELQKVSLDVALRRQQLCLPREAARFGIEPAREPAYVAGFHETARAVSSQELSAARERLRVFAEAYPDAPGVDMLACDLELRARRLPAASKRCGAVVEKFRESGRAHYLLGLIAANGGKETVAEQRLQKAIQLDPTDEAPWLALARLYRQGRSKQRLADLAARHQTLLQKPLPAP
jgi:hypothetical protein